MLWAQEASQRSDDDFRGDPAESRREQRERIREARENYRQRVDEWREARRNERRERMEQFRERFRGDGIHLRLLRSYTLPEGETSNEPIVVIGGSARIDGRAVDDVVVVGGTLHLGPKAIVEGDAVSVGGSVILEPGATVRGSIDDNTFPTISIGPSVWFGQDWVIGSWNGWAFWGSVFRLSLTMVVALFLTLIAPNWIASISSRSPGASILTGLAIEVLFVPALVVLIVALIVSIVGIPLLATIPFLLAAFAFVWVAGFTGVAVRIGRALRGRGGMQDVSVIDFLIGYTIIIGVTVLAQVMAYGLGWLSPVTWPMRSAGLLVEYVAWTVGLGAAVASLFAPRRLSPPPLPV
jgi:hypothetical protein